MSGNRPVIRQLQDVLRQGIDLIERLDDDEYGRTSEPLASASVGAHVRHVLDFISPIFSAMDTGRMDYDQRDRDQRAEVDREVALARLRSVSARLDGLQDVDSGTGLEVRLDAPPGTSDDSGWSTSTLGRELAFLLSHTVHHYALMGLLLRYRGIDPGREFGVAPSTLEYWKEIEKCAPQVG